MCTHGRRILPREQGPLELQTGRRVLLGKKKKNAWQRVRPLYENHRGISLLTLLHRVTPRTNGGVVCVYVRGRVHTQAYATICMSPSICSINSSRLSQSSARFGSNLSSFRHSLSSLSCLPEYIKKLPTNAGNN